MLTKEYIIFFKDLGQNNNRDWFLKQKDRYEKHAKIPFIKLIQNVLLELNKDHVRYPVEAQKTLFRINRDVRFSTDKSPYHTILKSSITQSGKKSEMPAIYIGADAHTLRIGGGLYMIPPQKSKAIRSFVASNIQELIALEEAPSFVSHYGRIKGDKYKREDSIAQTVSTKSTLLLHKQFYYMTELPLEKYLNRDLTSIIIPYIEAGKPVNQFLTDAIIQVDQNNEQYEFR